MSPFEQEIQELREEVTTLRGEVERLSALVTILVAAQGQPTLSSPASFQAQIPDVTVPILTKVANTPQHMPVLYGLDEVPLPHVSEVPMPTHLVRRSDPTDGPEEKEQRASMVNFNAATVIPIIKAAQNLGHQSTATVIPVFHAAQKHVATVTPVIKVAQSPSYQTQFQLYQRRGQQNLQQSQQPQRQHQGPQPKQIFPPIPMQYATLLPFLIAKGHCQTRKGKPPPNPMHPEFRTDLRCVFHQGARGHDVEECYALRYIVKKLIDKGELTFENNTSNVRDNSLSNHAPVVGKTRPLLHLAPRGTKP